jgi:hypothetical protein
LGTYRDKQVKLSVSVVEPVSEDARVSQRYAPGHVARVYAGTQDRDRVDGPLARAEFIGPESIAATPSGTVYVADSGALRVIKGGAVATVGLGASYLAPALVRCAGEDAFVLTEPWEDAGGGSRYAVVRLREGRAPERVHEADAAYTAVLDMAASPDGALHIIERNAGMGEVSLRALVAVGGAGPDAPGGLEPETVCQLPDGASALAFGDDGTAYVASAQSGQIQAFKDGKLTYVTASGQGKAFADGGAPLFYMPMRLGFAGGMLYVWDFNVLRVARLDGGAISWCETLAGVASPTFPREIAGAGPYAAEGVVFPNSALADFAVIGGRALLTDPKRGVIWEIE